jgi:hypothetical protein
MENPILSFKTKAIGLVCDDLILVVRLNNNIIFNQSMGTNIESVLYQFDDENESTYLLEFELMGKMPWHTQIDNNGNIIQDCLVHVYDIKFDDISIDELMFKLAKYHHDFNGTKEAVVDSFFGELGCNGIVRFEFDSPVYIWLLENM